jgi:hypothetical protein
LKRIAGPPAAMISPMDLGRFEAGIDFGVDFDEDRGAPEGVEERTEESAETFWSSGASGLAPQ